MKQAVFIAVAICGLSLAALPARAQGTGTFTFPNFSATTTMHINGRSISSKIARAGDKLRSDLPGSGGKRYTIVLIDKHMAYMVMGPTMCMEMPNMASMQTNPLASSSADKVDVKVLGAGTMNGHPVRIEEVTITPSNGGQAETMKVWAATDLHGFPVRTEMQTPRGTVATDYTDISLAPPPDSLFAIPNNCRAMPMPPQGMPHR